MNRSFLLWMIAIAVTLLVARYQRVTGPTYPVRGSADLGGTVFAYTLDRAHAGDGDHRVHLATGNSMVEGTLEWRPLDQPAWSSLPMTAVAGQLVGTIPHQPIGTKVAYRVRLAKMDRQLTLPAKDAVVLQFRGDVPAWALMPHVFVMLIAIFLSTLAGLEVLLPQPRLGVLVARTIAALVVGILLGCLTAWYAYGSLWSGFPVGDDVTANKTLLALVVWLAAAVALKVGRNPKPYVVIASVLTLAVYLIPHGAAIRK